MEAERNKMYAALAGFLAAYLAVWVPNLIYLPDWVDFSQPLSSIAFSLVPAFNIFTYAYLIIVTLFYVHIVNARFSHDFLSILLFILLITVFPAFLLAGFDFTIGFLAWSIKASVLLVFVCLLQHLVTKNRAPMIGAIILAVLLVTLIIVLRTMYLQPAESD